MATACNCMRFAADDPEAARIGLGAAALRYASMGYAVLPLVRGGKRPHQMLGGSGGVHWATHDPARIEGWWAQDPAANIGIATGQVSRLVVIDLDVKNGHNGWAEFASFTGAWSLPMTPGAGYVATPSGGQHIWLRTWTGWEVPERPGILDGVDVKGDGGLVAAPPSMLLRQPDSRPGSGGDPVPVGYLWASGCPHLVPPAPPWLPGWLERAPGTGSSASGAGDEYLPDLAEAKANGLAAGGRNVGLYRLACSLYRKRGSSDGYVLAELRQVWEASDQSGFTWSEALRTIRSAREWVIQREADDAAWVRHWAGRVTGR
jgi:Bifunctional DNA primase/polymerase, N-terminal